MSDSLLPTVVNLGAGVQSTARRPLEIISMGYGVQSSTAALMAAHGEITPMPDAAIFADTQSEPASVYRWADWLEGQLPFPVHRITVGDLFADQNQIRVSKNSGHNYIRSMIPAFIKNPDGSKGILGRRCTSDYKVRPMIKKTRELIGPEVLKDWRKVHRADIKTLRLCEREKRPPDIDAWRRCQSDPLARSWIGISTDEATRMKPSRVEYIECCHPLIEHRISRRQCFAWMKAHGYPEPPRSACSGCPFHSDKEWLRLQADEPKDFERAVQQEAELQAAALECPESIRGIPFLHASLKPLGEVEFKVRPGYEQLDLFENECEGMCGV